MKRILAFTPILSLLILAGNCCAQTGKDTLLWNWSEDSSHHDAVVQVACNGGTGTGVIIGLDPSSDLKNGSLGYCLTAWHVVAPDKKEKEEGKTEEVEASIVYRSGRKAKNCRVLAHDEQADVALLHVWVPPEVVPAKLAQAAVSGGDTLEFAGLGGGSELSCCLRHFTAVASPPSSGEKIFADATLLAGDSGGPVFNKNREVVGVISGGWFWYDGGVRGPAGQNVGTTWPARASNLGPIQEIMARVESTTTVQR